MAKLYIIVFLSYSRALEFYFPIPDAFCSIQQQAVLVNKFIFIHFFSGIYSLFINPFPA
jgi:hypothetical protein